MSRPDPRPDRSAPGSYDHAFAHADRIDLPAEVSQPSLARRFVRRGLDGVDGVDVGDAMLAISELVTNAVEHGSGEPVTVELATTQEAVVMRVTSPGPSPDLGEPDSWRPSDGRHSTGRGLAIVASVADGVEVDRGASSLVTTVHFLR